MELISLLILAAIAGYLFYQLRSILGQTPEDLNKKSLHSKYKTLLNKIDTQVNSSGKSTDTVLTVENSEDTFIKKSNDFHKDEITHKINNIKKRYPQFDLGNFIHGAKQCYDLIIDGFNKDLPEDLKPYMSENIYNGYRQLLDEYANKNYYYETIVTRIENAMIISAETDEVSAKITVEFQAHNISFLKNEENRVIQGDMDAVVAVSDRWTFERKYSSGDTYWVVVAIS